MVTDYQKIELEGTITSGPFGQGDDLFVYLDVILLSGIVTYKVVADGSTLDGFSHGDRLLVKGRIIRNWESFISVRADVSMTPPS